MIKKLLLATCALAGTLHADPLLEVKGGYFFFTNSTMRNIYHKGAWDLQVSGAYPMWRWLHVYGSVEHLQANGRSLNGCQWTKIQENNISLGLEAMAPIGCSTNYYLTVGPRYFFVRQKNDPAYVDGCIKNNGCGGFLNTGFLFKFCNGFTIDLFGEYSFKKMCFKSCRPRVTGHDIEIGGVTFGIGLGYTF